MKEMCPKGRTVDFPKEGPFVVFTPEEDVWEHFSGGYRVQGGSSKGFVGIQN